MLSTTNQRLKFFVDSLHISKTEFAAELGTSQPTMSQILSGKRPLSRGMVARIKAHYPKLNVTWLQTGEGDMALGVQTPGVSQFVGGNGSNYNNSPMLKESVGRVDETVVELTVNSDPKELMNEIHRLKALFF